MFAFLLTLGALRAGEAWDQVGPVPEGSRLVSESVSADLVRFGFEGEGPPYWLDVTLGEAGGFCAAGGLVVQVRRDLEARQESFELDGVPAPLALLCQRLPNLAPELKPSLESRRGDAKGTPSSPAPDGGGVAAHAPGSGGPVFARPEVRPSAFALIPLLAFGLVWAVGLARNTSRRVLAGAAGMAALALAVRAWGFQPTALLGGDAAYERLVSSLGVGPLDRYYGETWPAVHAIFAAATGAFGPVIPTDRVHWLNLAVSTLTPLALALLARRMGLRPLDAGLAGLALALHPHAVGMAQIEEHFVLVSALQMLGAAAAMGSTRRDAAASVAAAALLAHLRPEQLPVAGLILAPLFLRRAWAWGAVGAVLVISRLAYLPELPANGPIKFERLLHAGEWRGLVGRFVDGWDPPMPWLYVLALLGGLALMWHARSRPLGATLPWLWASALAAGTVVPYLPKDWPAGDSARFSLPAIAWVILFAAVALREIWEAGQRDKRLVVLAAVPVLISLRLPLPPAERATPRPWVWEEEYRFLRAELPAAARAVGAPGPGLAALALVRDERTALWYDASQDPNFAFGRWLALVSGMPSYDWAAGTPAAGDLLLRGSADRLARPGGEWLGQRCGLEVLVEREVAPQTDGWQEFGAEPVRLGLYRVVDCPPAAAEAL